MREDIIGDIIYIKNSNPDILVDTSIFIEFIFKNEHVKTVKQLYQEGRLYLCAPIMLEILDHLQIIQYRDTYVTIKDFITSIPIIDIPTKYYLEAAELHGKCRSSGIFTNSLDRLIAIVANKKKILLFHNDPSFEKIAKCIDIKFYK